MQCLAQQHSLAPNPFRQIGITAPRVRADPLFTIFALAQRAKLSKCMHSAHLSVIDSTMLNPTKGKTHVVDLECAL